MRRQSPVLDPPARLDDPETYRLVLERLRQGRERHGSLAQTDLELDEIPENADAELARLLARRVATGDYVFSPVTEREAFLGGKVRRVYRACLADTVVLFVLAGVLAEVTGRFVSRRVYSYRKGRSSREAMRDLARFVRAHRREIADVQARGLHVLRRDIKSYGDRIPVGDASPLWPLLARALAASGYGANSPFSRLLVAALRPEVLRLDGTLSRATHGVPMGSPLQPAICNLYLDALDRTLEAVPGGFYARFGDDILFAHPSAARALEASVDVEQRLASLELAANPEKSRNLFWNGAGRPASEPSSPDERGTTHLEYLGLCVAFDGAVAPSRRKVRRLQHELAARIAGSERLLRDLPLELRARTLNAAVSHALDPQSETCVTDAGELFTDGDDRRLLGELDRWLSVTIASALSGRPGVRALRSAPPRWSREHGLVSLRRRRDRAGGKREGSEP